MYGLRWYDDRDGWQWLIGSIREILEFLSHRDREGKPPLKSMELFVKHNLIRSKAAEMGEKYVEVVEKLLK